MNHEEIIAQVLKGKGFALGAYANEILSDVMRRALEIQQKEHERICNNLAYSLMRQIHHLEEKLAQKGCGREFSWVSGNKINPITSKTNCGFMFLCPSCRKELSLPFKCKEETK